jgi:precorrin-6B methylase 2
MDVNIQGWMSERELDWLRDEASRNSSVLEVGSWRGKSTFALCIGCKGPVIAVDHFLGSETERNATHADALTMDIYADFLKNMKGFKNLSVLRMESKFASQFVADKSIDMIFIDAGHEYEEVKADIESWYPKCKTVMCGHDYNNNVKSAVDEFAASIGKTVIEHPETIWEVRL